jgi:hypothetical protein
MLDADDAAKLAASLTVIVSRLHGLTSTSGRPGWRALAAAGVTALTLIATGCGAAQKPAQPTVSRPPLESIFQADQSLHANPQGTLDTLRKLGVDRIRLYVPWGSLGGWPPIAPDVGSTTPPKFDASDPAAYPASGWAIYDTIIRGAVKRGIGIDLTIGPPGPAWAAQTSPANAVAHPQWKPSPQAFEQFVKALGTRYSGHYKPLRDATPLPRVDFWAIWNEPNFGPSLAPQSIHHSQIEVSSASYRGLLDAAWSGLHATGHGEDTILIGELAPRGVTVGNSPGTFGYMVPLRFLRALYCVDSSYQPLRGTAAVERGCPTTASASAMFRSQHPALFEATAFADHPYPQGPPNVPEPDEPDYADLPSLPHLEQALDTVQRVYGSDKRFPIYSTEFGYLTDPPEKVAGTVSLETAAKYLNWSEYISWRDPRLRSYDQYLLVDGPRGIFASALEMPDGTPKPSYYAYRMPIFLPQTTTGSGQSLEVWGCVRPARFARIGTGRLQQARIQFQKGGSGPYSTVRLVPLTDPYGYFDVRQTFSGSGNVRLAWSYPHGPEIFSRIVAITIG